MQRGTDRQTDRQTDTQTAVANTPFASAMHHAKCKNWERASKNSVPLQQLYLNDKF